MSQPVSLLDAVEFAWRQTPPATPSDAPLGLSQAQWDGLPEQFRAGVVLALGWNEAAHPRAPKGSAGGGRFAAGPARQNDGGQAAKAQQNKGAADAADQLMKMDPAQRQAYLDSLSDDELKALSAYMFSFKSADAGVVQARTAIAGGLGRRGMNVNNYGGLGPKKPDGPRPAGAPPVTGLKGPGAPGAKPSAPGKKAAPGNAGAGKAAPGKPAARGGTAGSKVKGNSVEYGKVDDKTWKKLMAEGWKGDPNDGKEALYRPAAPAKRKPATRRHATLNSSHTGSGLALASSTVTSGDGAAVTINAYQRRKLAASGAAMADGSYPVTSKADLRKAVQAIGRAPAAKRPAVKAHLKRRAKALGVALPEAVKP